MKRLLLAGLLVLPFAIARAQQDDAYGSLVGMASAPDKGPTTETIPADGPPVEESRSAPEPADVSEYESGHARAAATPAPRKPSREPKREAAQDDDAPSVAVPAASAPRVWTKFFSALMPPSQRMPSFEVAVSTSPRRARPETARPATPASVAGSAQGIIELVAAATSAGSTAR